MFRRRNKTQLTSNVDNLREMIQRLRGLEAETLREIKTSSSAKNKVEARKEVIAIRQRIRVYQRQLSAELKKQQQEQLRLAKEKVQKRKVRRQNFENIGRGFVRTANQNLVMPMFSGQKISILSQSSYWRDFSYGR